MNRATPETTPTASSSQPRAAADWSCQVRGARGLSWWSWCRLAEPPGRVPRGTACPGCRLHEVQLGVVQLVVNELIAGGAVPADLDGSAAGGVTWGVVLVGVPAPPVGEQAERPGEFGAFGGELVVGTGRPLGVGPGYQQCVAFEPLEAVGQDVCGDARDLAEQVVEPARPGQQCLHHQQRPPVADSGSCLGERGGAVLGFS